jgi:hypothetical protein
MKLQSLKKEVPFDQFSRQYQVDAILSELRKKGDRFTILDVGGYKGRTADFLANDTVTVLDLYDTHEKNYVKGSALEMPFEDNSFDYVVSFDVLEHIAPDKRKRFFDECNRTAKHGTIICAPQKTPANERAESSLNNLYKRLHRKPHQWLREHIEYGIPDFDSLEKYINTKGLFTTRFHSNKIQLWTAMQEAIFINSKFPLASEKLLAINEFYNAHFQYDGGGAQEASYRLILCCLRDKTQKDLLNKRLSSLNKPLDPALEIGLYEKIAYFNATLTQKTDTLAGNYKKLYEHERSRAATLQSNNEELMGDIRTLEERLNRRLSSRVKNKVKAVPRKMNRKV